MPAEFPAPPDLTFAFSVWNERLEHVRGLQLDAALSRHYVGLSILPRHGAPGVVATRVRLSRVQLPLSSDNLLGVHRWNMGGIARCAPTLS